MCYHFCMKPKDKWEKRKILWKAQNGQCQYCLQKVPLKESTLDHVKPKSKGGSDQLDNLVMSCDACNNAKKDLEEPRAFPREWPSYLGNNYDKNF
jgi:5-methylcytosine-specific restriction endonuclease McrA